MEVEVEGHGLIQKAEVMNGEARIDAGPRSEEISRTELSRLIEGAWKEQLHHARRLNIV